MCIKGASMKRVFITGIAGFIGFHMAQALFKAGVAVTGIDNFNDYYSPDLKRARAAILEKLGIVIIEGDICDHAALERAIDKHQTTHILHLAAQAGVRYSLINPHVYLKTNLDGFLNVLEICRHRPNIKLVYASSSSVYGRNSKVPFSVQDHTSMQSSLYGVTKKSNELMAHTYHHLFGFPVIGLRFFTVYGPWGRPDMAYYIFTKAILEDRAIDVYNQGKIQRDFTYIDDIVSGILAALDLNAECEIFNLGNNHPVEILEFISELEDMLGKEAQKRFLPMQPGDVLITYADISESKERLGFSPQTSTYEGLQKFVKWYKEYAKVEVKL